jgi:hypothetical protein
MDSASYVLATMNIIFVSVLPQLCLYLVLSFQSLFLSLLLTFPTMCDLHILYVSILVATGNTIRNLLLWFYPCWYKSYLNYQKLLQIYSIILIVLDNEEEKIHG